MDALPSDQQIAVAEKALLKEAAKPLARKPKLRKFLQEMRTAMDQRIDETSKDQVLHAGFSAEAKDKAKALVQNFESFLEENRAEIDALAFFYAQPYRERLNYKGIKALHEAISAPPRSWTPQKLWSAYQLVAENKVKGVGAERRLTDIVSLIRFALQKDEELVPVASRVTERFANWMAQQENSGRAFSDEERWWLEMIRDHVAQTYEFEVGDFDLIPFNQKGGVGKAVQIFGQGLRPLIQELNEVLAV